MDKFHFALHYLKYIFLRTNEHGVHSPFVFELYNRVFKNNMPFYAYSKIEKLREKMLSDGRTVEVKDLGAGSGSGLKKSRTVAQITRTAAKEKKYAQLLFRLTDYFQPDLILELGTSIGIGTMYLAIARSKSTVITIEGCPETQKIALENFRSAELANITAINGDFDIELPNLLAGPTSPDLVYFDGNHRREATLRYFSACLAKAHNNSVFIVDDIYWSKEMTEAWETIKAHPEVTVTLDLFQLGVVFFRKEQAKQHFILKY